MAVTRELLILTATAIAWFTYAILTTQRESPGELVLDSTRVLALMLTAVISVRLLGALFDVLVETLWGSRATSLVRLVVYALMTAIATAVVLKEALDINVATLLTTSALLTAIIGLALQSPLSAFFSGVSLQIERQLRIGDVIRVDNRWAVVENIGWRSVVARRGDGTALMVPNSFFAGHSLAVRQRGSAIASEIVLPGPLTTPPAVITDVITEVVGGIPQVSDEHPIQAAVTAIRPELGIAEFFVRFVTHQITTDEQALAGMVRLRLWYAYQRYGIALPHPEWLPARAQAWDSHVTEPTPEITAALAASQRWRTADDEARQQLLAEARRLLFAPQEPIQPPPQLDGALAILIAGTIRLRSAERAQAAEIEPPIASAGISQLATGWKAEELLPVEEQLGIAIGPYARVAVQRTAQATASPVELYRRLAELIPTEEERQRFLSQAQVSEVQDFGVGTVIRLRRGRPARLRPVARERLELLVLPAASAEPSAAQA